MEKTNKESPEFILLHLASCEAVCEKLEEEEEGAIMLLGPKGSTFSDLLCAILSGFELGWVDEVHLITKNGKEELNWSISDRGTRAIHAFRRRQRKQP
jgi:hypothetical protein